jgi:nucleotide-binding universal stress UspA family protein
LAEVESGFAMVNIKRILCPIDLSESSAHALEQAAAVARWYKASLVGLHVCSPSEQIPGLANNDVPELDFQCIRDQVDRFAKVSLAAAGTSIEVTVDAGQPARAILARAAALPADLIVMGTHGARGFDRLMLGSVTEKVLRKATCPVLTVPPRARVTSRFPFSRVLCAVDFSDWSLAALDMAASLAAESGAALDLLHVVEWPWPEPPPPTFADVAPAQAAALLEFRRYLKATATARLESFVPEAIHRRSVVTTQIAHGKAYTEIIRLAAASGDDLIVLGVHSRARIDLTMFGSTTNHVVRSATCPVLTVRR